jgi:hypothetical protein
MVMEESITWDDQELQTPAEYFQLGRLCLKLATTATTKNQSFDRSANLAILAIASALLGLCAQFIADQEDD